MALAVVARAGQTSELVLQNSHFTFVELKPGGFLLLYKVKCSLVGTYNDDV